MLRHLRRYLSKHQTIPRLLGYEPTIWTRKVSDEETRKLIARLRPSELRVLEVSGRVWEHSGFLSYRNTEYPEFDVCEGSLDEKFDLIIAEHIFEHLLYPYRAARNLFQMLTPGGHLLVVTPFIYKIHPNPYDCTRWTPEGLKYFLADCGFPLEGVQVGSWGNRQVIEATFRKEFRRFNRYLHGTENDPCLPVVVWALARREV